MKRKTYAALLLAAAATAANPACGAEVALAYEIRLGGLMAGTIDLKAEIGAERYQVSAQTRTRGLIDMLVGFRSAAATEGRRGQNSLQPLAHQADNEWRGEARHVRITFDEEGAEASVSPPPELDDRDPVPMALTKDAIDPLSAALQAALAAEAGRPCEGRLDVFDGRRRYTLHFEDRLREADGLHCRLRLERIAGLSHDPWLPVMEPIETAELWIAPQRGDLPPIPLRLQAHTAFGAAIVRLTAIDGAPP